MMTLNAPIHLSSSKLGTCLHYSYSRLPFRRLTCYVSFFFFDFLGSIPSKRISGKEQSLLVMCWDIMLMSFSGAIFKIVDIDRSGIMCLCVLEDGRDHECDNCVYLPSPVKAVIFPCSMLLAATQTGKEDAVIWDW